MQEGSLWFRRFVKECKKMSPHIKFRRVKYGFYRMYWINGGQPAYLHEVYKEMPYVGFELDDLDPRFENQKYYEEYEDQGEMSRKIKNFVEGYWDSLRTVRKRLYLLKNNDEFRRTATDAYTRVVIK